MALLSIHHVQLALPEGGEDAARAFFPHLGFAEVPKPPALAARGGVWFEAGNVRLHLGVEQPFRPATKAHPAFEVSDLAAMTLRLRAAGIPVLADEGLPDHDRVYLQDPFGNRIELLERRQ
ncbi:MULTISPECIES: VOC family protein [unclassified Haematobacter]|uniref:VOC family protein n=1 Tax=unclassified Haematobacter TaxID=2640585 RepID=UPI0025BC741A|nr:MULTISPECIES: VOC family protein [unclassified Haematobacter]